jgi:hypothetical protein
MDDRTLKIVAIWGACVSTILGLVKLWETFWKDRVRLVASGHFTTQEGVSDEIVIVNLSGAAVQVSYWTLAWKPNFFRRNTSKIDVTPEGNNIFAIPANDRHVLEFQEQDKFDWSHRGTLHSQLYLTMHIFGRRKPKVLKVHAG